MIRIAVTFRLGRETKLVDETLANGKELARQPPPPRPRPHRRRDLATICRAGSRLEKFYSAASAERWPSDGLSFALRL